MRSAQPLLPEQFCSWGFLLSRASLSHICMGTRNSHPSGFMQNFDLSFQGNPVHLKDFPFFLSDAQDAGHSRGVYLPS